MPLSVTNRGIVPQLDDVAKTSLNDNRRLVRAGDFVINSRSDRRGSSGTAELDGSVSVISIVLTPRQLDPAFVHHLLRSSAFQEEFYRWGNGIVADLWSTRYSSMKSIVIPVPPLREQHEIAKQLDRETAVIDELIAEQEALLASMAERRTTMVLDAVSGGPASGQRLRHVVTRVRQGWSPQCEAVPADEAEWGVLKTGCVNRGAFRPEENKRLPDDVEPRPETVVRRGEIVVSRASTRDLVGSAAVIDGEYPRLMLSDKLYALTVDESAAEPEYVALRLGTRPLRDLIELEASGASHSMQNISQADILNLPMDLPPVDDQRAALAALRGRTAQIDELTAECRELIALLKERRAALITAAVTGKIDVRAS
ncbi:hypothetical protein [Nocardioides sp.]|uniref:hypothetical protein n=1 Tax=Nocardioides sp. TaxID=35761 RepID=UPI002ED7F60B